MTSRKPTTSREPNPAPTEEEKLQDEEEAFIESLSQPEPELPTYSQIVAPVIPETADLAATIKLLVAQALNDLIPAPVVAPAPPPVVEDEGPSELSDSYPVVYFNPKVIDEQFYVLGSPYRHRFVKARYVAADEAGEASVRACLESHGRGFADRWKGEDRREWVDRRTGARISNENARYDFELYHED